jgi:predicted SprT family Zn-dependent metalloprotease
VKRKMTISSQLLLVKTLASILREEENHSKSHLHLRVKSKKIKRRDRDMTLIIHQVKIMRLQFKKD